MTTLAQSAPQPITLTPLLLEENAGDAVAALRGYFRPLAAGGAFTGGEWDTFDPSGTRSESANVFTADDLVSVSLLSVPVKGAPAHRILVRERDVLSALLARLPLDVDFADLPSVRRQDWAPAWELYERLGAGDGVGPTIRSKLMARKRPRLFPIVDRVVRDTVLGGRRRGQWEALHATLRADDRQLHRHLLHLHHEAGLRAAVSALRVFDVLSWLDGAGKAGAAIRSAPGSPLTAYE